MYSEDDFVMKNPNLYVTLSASGGIWSPLTNTWQEALPWTLNAPI